MKPAILVYVFGQYDPKRLDPAQIVTFGDLGGEKPASRLSPGDDLRLNGVRYLVEGIGTRPVRPAPVPGYVAKDRPVVARPDCLAGDRDWRESDSQHADAYAVTRGGRVQFVAPGNKIAAHRRAAEFRAAFGGEVVAVEKRG